MRIYLGVDAEALRMLAAGLRLESARVAPDSEDEQEEADAMLTAAEDGPVVVAAEVDRAEDPVALSDVSSFHLDIDGSGQLAWFASQELADVIDRVAH